MTLLTPVLNKRYTNQQQTLDTEAWGYNWTVLYLRPFFERLKQVKHVEGLKVLVYVLK